MNGPFTATWAEERASPAKRRLEEEDIKNKGGKVNLRENRGAHDDD